MRVTCKPEKRRLAGKRVKVQFTWLKKLIIYKGRVGKENYLSVSDIQIDKKKTKTPIEQLEN